MTTTDTGPPHLLIERRGHVLVVTMNRPQVRNALSGPMLALLRKAWDQVDSDPAIRVCVLTGAGGAFCAGADLKAMTRAHPGDAANAGAFDPSVIEPLLKGRRLTKPLIAAVEGVAVAGGTEILQATDIRVAGESARFGVSEARWGLFPLGGSAVRLPRQIPYTVAADLLLTGRHITAAEALQIGLIGHVVPDGQALRQGPGDRRDDRGERPGRGPRDPAHHPGDRGPARGRRLQDRGPDRHGGVPQRRRQGRPARLHRKAQAPLPRPLGSASTDLPRNFCTPEHHPRAHHAGSRAQMARSRPAQ